MRYSRATLKSIALHCILGCMMTAGGGVGGKEGRKKKKKGQKRKKEWFWKYFLIWGYGGKGPSDVERYPHLVTRDYVGVCVCVCVLLWNVSGGTHVG